jgi:leucine efflux protein
VFYGITDLPTFILGTIFIILLLGPNSLYVMTVLRAGVSARAIAGRAASSSATRS